MKWRIVTDGEVFKIQVQRGFSFLTWWGDNKETNYELGERKYTPEFSSWQAAQNYLDSLVRQYHMLQRKSFNYQWEEVKQFDYLEWRKDPTNSLIGFK